MLDDRSNGCCVGGDNIGNGNQVADGAVSLGGKAISGSDSTSGGQANGGTNSITGRRSLLTWGSSSNPNPKPSNPAPTNNIACSTGFVAVKSGVGSICVQQADGKFSRHTASRRNCSAHLLRGRSFCEENWQSMQSPDRATSWAGITPCSHCMLPLCLPACQPMQPESAILELC